MVKEIDTARYRKLLKRYGHMLTEVQREVAERLFSSNPPTMSALARERGVTPVAISQTKHSAAGRLDLLDTDPNYLPGRGPYVAGLLKRRRNAMRKLREAQEYIEAIDRELDLHRSDVAAQKRK